jgi:hypothetical protein
VIRPFHGLLFRRRLAVRDIELIIRVSRAFGWHHWPVGRIGGVRHVCEGRPACRHGVLGHLRRGRYGYCSHMGEIHVSGAGKDAVRRGRSQRRALQARYTTATRPEVLEEIRSEPLYAV